MILMSAAGTAGDETQSKPATPVAAAQDPDRPALSATELKALRDNNIFSPRTVRRVPKTDRKSGPREVIPYRQKAPVVTGIFLDLNTQTHQAIVEDKNDSAHRYFKEPKFMKIGDEWSGIKLQAISPDKAVFLKDGNPKEVRIGESLPESDEKPLSAAAEPGDDPFSDDGETPAPDAPAASSSPTKSKKGMTAPDAKAMTPEAQTRTLDEMKKRLKKKNRPGDNEE
jgi:hypothetical protein